MAVADAWHITRSKSACCSCGVEFRPGQAFFSALRENEAELERRDFCPPCWEQACREQACRGQGEQDGHFCFWKSRRAADQGQRPVNTELLLEFFERLDSLQTDQKGVFRFVLALYLMRRKEFKLLEIERTDGTEKLLFERRATGERLEVASPGLDDDQIQQAEEQLSRLLNVCL